jgi:hypothetical protein
MTEALLTPSALPDAVRGSGRGLAAIAWGATALPSLLAPVGDRTRDGPHCRLCFLQTGRPGPAAAARGASRAIRPTAARSIAPRGDRPPEARHGR